MTKSCLLAPLGLLGLLATLSAPAQAQDPEAPLRAVTECRSIQDDLSRLACYDRTASALEVSLDTGAVIAVRREDVDTVERDSFGLDLPNLGQLARSVLGSGVNDALTQPSPSQTTAQADPEQATPLSREEVLARADAEAATRSGVQVQERDDEGRAIVVQMAIARFEPSGYNQGAFHMTNEQIWTLTRSQSSRIRVRDGDVAHIRRTRSGIHVLRINGSGSSMRVRRVQ